MLLHYYTRPNTGNLGYFLWQTKDRPDPTSLKETWKCSSDTNSGFIQICCL